MNRRLEDDVFVTTLCKSNRSKVCGHYPIAAEGIRRIHLLDILNNQGSHSSGHTNNLRKFMQEWPPHLIISGAFPEKMMRIVLARVQWTSVGRGLPHLHEFVTCHHSARHHR